MYGDRTPFKNALDGLRILIVDDKRDTRLLIENFLDYTGAMTTCVSSGTEALQSVGEQFDAVLMDIQMPEICGVETARQMRAQGFIGVIIAMSAGQYPEVDANFPNAIFDSFVSKPYEFKNLVGAILSGFEDWHE